MKKYSAEEIKEQIDLAVERSKLDYMGGTGTVHALIATAMMQFNLQLEEDNAKPTMTQAEWDAKHKNPYNLNDTKKLRDK